MSLTKEQLESINSSVENRLLLAGPEPVNHLLYLSLIKDLIINKKLIPKEYLS